MSKTVAPRLLALTQKGGGECLIKGIIGLLKFKTGTLSRICAVGVLVVQ